MKATYGQRVPQTRTRRVPPVAMLLASDARSVLTSSDVVVSDGKPVTILDLRGEFALTAALTSSAATSCN